MKGMCERCNTYSSNLHEPLAELGPSLCPACIDKAREAKVPDKGEAFLKMSDVKKAKEREMVNHPSHYGGDTVYEVIKVAEAWGFMECGYRFTILRYLYRAGRKFPKKEVEDLKKARWYLDRLISRLEAAPTDGKD